MAFFMEHKVGALEQLLRPERCFRLLRTTLAEALLVCRRYAAKVLKCSLS